MEWLKGPCFTPRNYWLASVTAQAVNSSRIHRHKSLECPLFFFRGQLCWLLNLHLHQVTEKDRGLIYCFILCTQVLSIEIPSLRVSWAGRKISIYPTVTHGPSSELRISKETTAAENTRVSSRAWWRCPSSPAPWEAEVALQGLFGYKASSRPAWETPFQNKKLKKMAMGYITQ